MIYLQSMIAFDVARERSAEAVARARRHRQLDGVTSGRFERRPRVSAALALAAAQLSRGSAGLARRLDAATANAVLPDAGPCLP